MAFKINDNGTWKTPTKFHVNDNGSWKEVQTGYVNDLGVWREFYSSGPETASYKFGFYNVYDTKEEICISEQTQGMWYTSLFRCNIAAESTYEIQGDGFLGDNYVVIDTNEGLARIDELRYTSNNEVVIYIRNNSTGQAYSQGSIANWSVQIGGFTYAISNAITNTISGTDPTFNFITWTNQSVNTFSSAGKTFSVRLGNLS